MESKRSLKFLCSYGRKILPRATDDLRRYVGCHTRVLAVHPSISFPVDGEDRRVLWFVSDVEVSIADRRFRDADFGKKRRRFGDYNWRYTIMLRRRWLIVEDQSRSLAISPLNFYM